MKGSISSYTHYQLQEIKSTLNDLLQTKSNRPWEDKGQGGCSCRGEGGRQRAGLQHSPTVLQQLQLSQGL